ncbi:hypothetical protein K7432_011880 [Basidiobolus ranarum]|uniref:Secreted protein n=1 Tax=Basidiobolus ranarum TaxID=34480 RepID=A0ABR2VT54_9FUNG
MLSLRMWWTLVRMICFWPTLATSKIVLQDPYPQNLIWGSQSLGICAGPTKIKCSRALECVRRIGYETNEFGLCRESGELGTSCGGVRINPRTLGIYRASTNCKLGLSCKQSRRFPNIPGKCMPVI